MNEIWKTIEDYPDYEVSNLGNVKSFKKSKETILRCGKSGCGYLTVVLRNNGCSKSLRVNRLVAAAFLGKSDLQVNHINENKLDNRLDNLEYVSNRENCSYRDLNKKTTSEFIGVCWDKSRNKWTSGIRINGKRINLGRFKNEIDAYNAYLKALDENGLTNKYA